jgi:hypothetical protein
MSDIKPLSVFVVPPAPTVKSKFEFDMLSDEAKAQALFAWSDFWLHRPTPTMGARSDTPIVIPAPDVDPRAEWAPTAEERASLNDWNKS